MIRSFVFGDLGKQWESCIDAIACENKILIIGNHDKMDKSKYFEYFKRVFDGPTFLNQSILLSHEPWFGCEYCINIHGHLHNARLDDEHYINANVAQNNYMPICVDDEIISEKVKKLKKNHEKFLEEWYAPKYYFLTEKADTPILNHKLIKDYQMIEPYIKEYNSINGTNYWRRNIDWSNYSEPLKDFIFNQLDEKERKKNNEDPKN